MTMTDRKMDRDILISQSWYCDLVNGYVLKKKNSQVIGRRELQLEAMKWNYEKNSYSVSKVKFGLSDSR